MNLINSLRTILVLFMYNFDVRAKCEEVKDLEALPQIFRSARKNLERNFVNPQDFEYWFGTARDPKEETYNEVTVLKFDNEQKFNDFSYRVSKHQFSYRQIKKKYEINLQTFCFQVNGLLYFAQTQPEGDNYKLLKLEEGQLREWLQKFTPGNRVIVYKKLYKILRELQKYNFPIESISIGDFLVFGQTNKFAMNEIDPLISTADKITPAFYPRLADDRYVSAYIKTNLSQLPPRLALMSKLKDLIMHIECHPTKDSILYYIYDKDPQDFQSKTPNPKAIKCDPDGENPQAKVLNSDIQKLIVYLEKNWNSDDFNLSNAFAKIEPEQLPSHLAEVFQENASADHINREADLMENLQNQPHRSYKKNLFEKHRARVEAKKKPLEQSSALERFNRAQNSREQIQLSLSEKLQMVNLDDRMIQSHKPSEKLGLQAAGGLLNKPSFAGNQNIFGAFAPVQNDDLLSPKFGAQDLIQPSKNKQVRFNPNENQRAKDIDPVRRNQIRPSFSDIQPNIDRVKDIQIGQERKQKSREERRKIREVRFRSGNNDDENEHLVQEHFEIPSVNNRFMQQPGPVVRKSKLKKFDPEQRKSDLEKQSIAAQNRPPQREDEESKRQSKNSDKKQAGCFSCFLPKNIV